MNSGECADTTYHLTLKCQDVQLTQPIDHPLTHTHAHPHFHPLTNIDSTLSESVPGPSLAWPQTFIKVNSWFALPFP